MNRIALMSIAATLALGPNVATAEAVSFDRSWKHQKFSLFSRNDYGYGGGRLSIASDAAVSLTYKPLPRTAWVANGASWSWKVDQSVPATDLRKKGGDDRNIALYAVFLPEAEATRLEGARVTKLLSNDKARVLVYVWGGAHGNGQVLASPYLGARGKTVVLRGAGTGSFSESVSFAKDYSRAFGGQKGALVGLAISGDSDDTASAIRASISNLRLK